MSFDWITNLLTNGYGVLALVFVLVVGIYLVKTGKISIKTKHVSLGIKEIREQEAYIRQMQWEFITSYIDATRAKLPEDVRNTDKCKYILKCCCDIYESAVCINNIKRDETYKNLKFELLISAVLKRTDREWFKSEEFYALARSVNDRLIDKLVEIRALYEKD